MEWPLDPERGFFGPVRRVVFELKLLHKGLKRTLAEGPGQTAGYIEGANADEGHLIICNRDREVPRRR